MRYVVDARISNGKPSLRVIDAVTGAVRLQWTLGKINRMFAENRIPEEEFLRPERYGMNLLVKNLFLISCAQELRASVSGGRETGRPGKPNTPKQSI